MLLSSGRWVEDEEADLANRLPSLGWRRQAAELERWTEFLGLLPPELVVSSLVEVTTVSLVTVEVRRITVDST